MDAALPAARYILESFFEKSIVKAKNKLGQGTIKRTEAEAQILNGD